MAFSHVVWGVLTLCSIGLSMVAHSMDEEFVKFFWMGASIFCGAVFTALREWGNV